MTRIKQLILALVVSLGLAVPMIAPVHAQNIRDELRNGACLNTDGADCGEDAEGAVNGILKQGIQLFSFIVGIIAVVMIIIGGVKYITSGGDSGNVTGAKNTILYAVIGLIVVALAQVIVRFVLDKTVVES